MLIPRGHEEFVILLKNNDLKIKDAYLQLIDDLSSIYEKPEAEAIGRIIFEDLGYSRLEIFSSSEVLKQSGQKKLTTYAKRLLSGEPVQYVLGYAWFYGRKIKVNEHCLIPRQETEMIIQCIKELKLNNPEILDIGTGSGCIALTLKAEIHGARVHAMDKDPLTLDLAKKNFERNNLDIVAIQDDILKPDYNLYPEPFALIVSNPPYVRNFEKEKMHQNVKEHEPAIALFVPDNDPLIFYRALKEFSKQKLQSGGSFIFEINEALGQETYSLFNDHAFTSLKLMHDLNGKDRFILGRKK